MTTRADRFAELSRMQEARRQIQRQLDRINRQITRRMTAFIPQLKPRHSSFRRGKAPEPSAFLDRYRAKLAALTAERQPEIDALSRKLARQDAAIEAFCQRHGLVHGREAQPPADRASAAPFR
jgi:DNA relaxase NicK